MANLLYVDLVLYFRHNQSTGILWEIPSLDRFIRLYLDFQTYTRIPGYGPHYCEKTCLHLAQNKCFVRDIVNSGAVKMLHFQLCFLIYLLNNAEFIYLRWRSVPWESVNHPGRDYCNDRYVVSLNTFYTGRSVVLTSRFYLKTQTNFLPIKIRAILVT